MGGSLQRGRQNLNFSIFSAQHIKLSGLWKDKIWQNLGVPIEGVPLKPNHRKSSVLTSNVRLMKFWE